MRALITGILGQDGSYIAELLHKKGYEVYGIIKGDTHTDRIEWIQNLVPEIKLYAINLLDKSKLREAIINIKPDEIYNFAGYSNVFSAWDNMDEVMDINARVPQNILEIILKFNKSIKFFQASSCLIFGNDTSEFQNEKTAINPIHFYGASKVYADAIVKEFRRVHGIYACSGIFFNHESERRGDNFFTKKITREVNEIKQGKREKIKVGNLSSFRDMGYANDFMKAAYLMMQQKLPKDYVIGTGGLITMRGFVEKCFEHVGLDYEDYVEVDQSLYRSNDTGILRADTTKINKDLGWQPKHDIDDIVKIMMDA